MPPSQRSTSSRSAHKESSEIAADQSYALGEYSFRVERSSVPGSTNDKIEAICTKDNKNARKSIQVPSNYQFNGWYVEANNTTADVYAIVGVPEGGTGKTSDLDTYPLSKASGMGSISVVYRNRADTEDVEKSYGIAGGYTHGTGFVVTNEIESGGEQYTKIKLVFISAKLVDTGGYEHNGKMVEATHNEFIYSLSRGLVSCTGPIINGNLGKGIEYNKIGWTLVYGASTDPDYKKQGMLVGRFAIELEDAGGTGEDSDWEDPGDEDPEPDISDDFDPFDEYEDWVDEGGDPEDWPGWDNFDEDEHPDPYDDFDDWIDNPDPDDWPGWDDDPDGKDDFDDWIDNPDPDDWPGWDDDPDGKDDFDDWIDNPDPDDWPGWDDDPDGKDDFDDWIDNPDPDDWPGWDDDPDGKDDFDDWIDDGGDPDDWPGWDDDPDGKDDFDDWIDNPDPDDWPGWDDDPDGKDDFDDWIDNPDPDDWPGWDDFDEYEYFREKTYTLNLDVTGALSGRHNDPLNDTSYSYIPADKETVADYGCGGDGGHGGGGGGGASTVVVHKFATSRAGSKEIIAKARRHGYGSGGGKGGKGGDGCIIIYY